MNLTKFTQRLCVLSLILVVFASFAMAQTSRGTVTGTVTDPTGAIVANATVTLTNTGTTVNRETKTNSAGLYRFDAVDLGIYNVSATAAGFVTGKFVGIDVRANQNVALDFSLKIGSTQEVVEVQAAGAQVVLQTSEQLRGGSISEEALTTLPISGQNSLNLMTTVAGIVPSNNGVADSGVGSVNGSRTRANNFMIDGADNNDISVAGPAIVMTNNDAIQEVSIQTANFSAEFGRSGGAVVNQVTKSGTNHLHGTAAWVYLSNAFDASSLSQRNSFFAKKRAGIPDPRLKAGYTEQIPAYTIGGPVVIPGLYDGHNKTFWFAAGQWDRYSTGAVLTPFTVPTAAGMSVLQGLAASCPNVQLYLRALNGLTAPTRLGTIPISIPNGAYAAGTTCDGTNRAGMSVEYGQAYRSIPQMVPAYNMQYRLDHTISARQNLSARFYMDSASVPSTYVGISRPFDADYTGKNYSFVMSHTFVVSNTATNELRANYVRMAPVWTVVDSTGLGSLPTFTIATLSPIGTSSNYPQGRTANTYQLQDTFTKLMGHHQFRFGGELFRQIARQSAPVTARGNLNYSDSGSTATDSLVFSLANFIDDYSGPGSARVSKQYGSPIYHPSYWSESFFFQDTWKVLPTLTLNLGIRYDYFGQPANIFDFPMVSMDTAGFTKNKIPTDKNNWGPSVGFAWNPKFDSKMVVRGGFQVGYDRWFNNLLSNMASGAPNNVGNLPVNCTTAVGCTGRGFDHLWATRFGAMTNGGIAVTNDTSSQYPANIRNPYTERWSFGIQHELTGGMILDVSYVGSASHKLYQQQQLNPYGTPAYNATTGVYSLGTRLNPALGARMVRASAGNSNYHGLQTTLNSRTAKTAIGNLQFTAAYTWSKNLSVVDEVFGTYASGVYMSANPLLYNNNRNLDYGLSDNDRRHRLVSTLSWDIRGPKNGFLGKTLGGWTLSGVLPIQSATPFTIYNGIDRDLDGTNNTDRPDIANAAKPLDTMAKPVPLTGVGSCSTGYATPTGTCVTPADVHWIYYPTGSYKPVNANTEARNSLHTKTGSILANVNVIKKFKVREGLGLEARAEIFNIFNHQNFNFVPTYTALSTIFSSPATQFLNYGLSDAGHRTMRVGLKATF